MGIIKSTGRTIGKVAGQIVNIRVDKWIGIDNLKDSAKSQLNLARNFLTPEEATRVETFEESLERLELTEQDLEQRKHEFTRLMLIYLIAATLIFSYTLFITIKYTNYLGLFMGTSVTFYALLHVLKYHFWIYQINRRKLGCTIKEWWNSIE